MPEDKPQITTITSTDLQRKIGEVTRQAAQDGVHFIVERDGFPVLAVISATEYRLLLQERDHLRAMLQSKPIASRPSDKFQRRRKQDATSR